MEGVLQSKKNFVKKGLAFFCCVCRFFPPSTSQESLEINFDEHF